MQISRKHFPKYVLGDQPTKVKFFDCWADDIAGQDKKRWKVICDISKSKITMAIARDHITY